KDMKIKFLEEIYLFFLLIKESELTFFLRGSLEDRVLKMMPVRKQPCVGQRTGFKAFVAIEDHNRYLRVEVENPTAIRGAIHHRHGGNKVGKAHAVPYKGTCCYGSVLVDLIPAPRGVASAPVTKKLPTMASSNNCYTPARGCMPTLGNLAEAISKTYRYLTPDLWKETVCTKSPYQEFTYHLVENHTRVCAEDPGSHCGHHS
uniref:Small ribosomal subunit protein uS5 n=1 Tax=Mustela putorius furo TaxID=9669 RepID=M3XZY1_MUSPF